MALRSLNLPTGSTINVTSANDKIRQLCRESTIDDLRVLLDFGCIEDDDPYSEETWTGDAMTARAGTLLDIEPPAGTIDAMTYLVPPDHGDQGWLVRVHGRTQQVDFPLYRDGGACAAFDTAGGALDAAVNALHIEIAVTAHR